MKEEGYNIKVSTTNQQVHIDEFRDYDKALSALQDSLKYMDKSKAHNKEMKIEQVGNRIQLVEQFVEARNLTKTDPGKMVEVCNDLLSIDALEGAVRVGDVYALLVEFYTGQKQYDQAYQLIERMRDAQIILSYYLETQLVQAVYNQMGIEYTEQEQQRQTHSQGPMEDHEDIDEEIDEGD